jgi:hypothetical protein
VSSSFKREESGRAGGAEDGDLIALFFFPDFPGDLTRSPLGDSATTAEEGADFGDLVLKDFLLEELLTGGER